MAWNYTRNESEGFSVLPEGDYKVRIKTAEKAVSKSGKDMLKLEFEVSGTNNLLFHYIVFLEDRPEITNRNLTNFFDSFAGIPEGDFNTANWVGKVGACHVKHEEYNGEPQARVHYFINASKQGTLPAWKEPEKKANSSDSTTSTNGGNDVVAVVEDVNDDSKLPF